MLDWKISAGLIALLLLSRKSQAATPSASKNTGVVGPLADDCPCPAYGTIENFKAGGIGSFNK